MNNNLEPQNVKDYYNNGTRKILKVTPNDNYLLTILFDNDGIRNYDMSDKSFGIFHILNAVEKFKQVFVDEAGNMLI